MITITGADRDTGNTIYQIGFTAPATAYGLHNRYCCVRFPRETFAGWLRRHYSDSEALHFRIVDEARASLIANGINQAAWGID